MQGDYRIGVFGNEGLQVSNKYIYKKISFIYKKYFRLTREDFIYITTLIIEVFSHETAENYYIPSQGSSSPSKGRLYQAYTHLRGMLNKAGLAEPLKAANKNGEYISNLMTTCVGCRVRTTSMYFFTFSRI